MSFEQFSKEINAPVSETKKLAQNFYELPTHSNAESHVFENLEDDLKEKGFEHASNNTVSEILNNQSLLCRSESFSRVMDLLLTQNPLTITQQQGEANICIMASGKGFSTAMQEGFSGKDVGGLVKVVISFRDTHLIKRESLSPDNKLWGLKPNTAQVSLSGGGNVEFEDIEMVSFRFPIRHYPEHLLTEDEQDRAEADNIKFIVRHYTNLKKKALH